MNYKKEIIRGFTLIELLVVLAVMGVMMGMLGFSILGGEGDVNAAQRQVLSLLHQTRAIALGSGTEARLIVMADNSNQEKYMRYAGIVLRDRNASGDWLGIEEGIYLQDGIWFVDQNAETVAKWKSDAFTTWSVNGEDTYFNLGELKKGKRSDAGQSSNGGYRYIAFDGGDGSVICEDYPKMPRMVLSPGQLRSISGVLTPYFSNVLGMVGIELRPFGGILCLDSNDFSSDD